MAEEIARTARPYQVEQYNAVRAAHKRGLKRVVVEAATGVGKSVLFSLIARDVVKKGGRVLLLVNRDNLCKQAASHLGKVCGKAPSIEKGDEIGSRFAMVVVGSIQSLQGKRLSDWPVGHFKYIIIDECHIAASPTVRKILKHFEDAYWLGVTATVERHDKSGVFFHFQEVVHEFPLIKRTDLVVSHGMNRRKFSKLRDAEKYIDKLPEATALKCEISEESIHGAIDEGWLVPIKFHQLPVGISVTSDEMAKMTEDEESKKIERYLKQLSFALKDNIGDTKTLAFLPDCESSMAYAQMLRDIGVRAEHVEGVGTREVYEKDADGKCVKDAQGRKIVKETRKFSQEDYNGVIERWKSGETQVVTNATILYIGFDYPAIACVALLRIIKSTPMIKQCIGRGTRTMPDAFGRTVDNFDTAEDRKSFIAQSLKPSCTVLDLALQCDEHDFSSPPCLISDYHDKAKKIQEVSAGGSSEVDLEFANNNFQKSRVTELQAKLLKMAEKLANRARKKGKATSVFLHDILKTPIRDFDVPASYPQINYIKSLARDRKIDESMLHLDKLTKYQASRIIGRLQPKKVTV